MTDFNDFQDLSYEIQNVSDGFWTQSIDFSQMADQAWLDGDTQNSIEWQIAADNSEWYSDQMYQASWDAWYGPVNSEGYTAYDASMGYTSTDTSFIEPASSAASTSMISDNSATSWL
ncbi:MAG: hypothetical protein AAB131_06195 [Actinomycetota bacterium]|jgi:hypothetical protein|nr:MAG: hypothetical protein FD127_2618 [Acidimicrobiaceae bacterium]